MIKELVVNVVKGIIKAFYSIRVVYLFKTRYDEYIFLKGYFIEKNGKLINYNWGDDLNIYFLSELSQKKIEVCPDTYITRLFNVETYMCIGSTLANYNLKNTIIWGSGLINDKTSSLITVKPKGITAVRGPKTRNWLLEQEICCPEVYGDPALLLPLYYKPNVNEEKKYIGLIPHYIDLENENVRKLEKEKNVKLIKVQNYKKWTDFIDEINQCCFVISSSLHGLIVSEAYGVPSVWAKFGEYVDGWDFKFYDFYESIGKKNENSMSVNERTTIKDFEEKVVSWEKGSIDLEPLVKACPFSVDNKVLLLNDDK